MMKKAVRKRKLFARMGVNACCGRTRRSAVDADKLAQIRQTVTPDHLAAILYTSGSTAFRRASRTQGSVMATPKRRLNAINSPRTLFSAISRRFSTPIRLSTFSRRVLGAKACMIPATALSFPKTLVNYLRQKGITELTMTPSSFVQVANKAC